MKRGMITGRLVARTAVHIGSGFGDQTTDALLFRDARSEWLIPGTSLGGVLRTMATRLAPRLGMQPCQVLSPRDQRRTDSACACQVCHLFGDLQLSEQEAEENAAWASRLWVYDARRCEVNVETALRDAVGIDRSSGAAARTAAAKFDLEVIPAGTAFTFRIELEKANADDEQLLACALAEWCEGRAWIGGNKSRGLGAFALQDLQWAKYNLDAPESLMAFLESDSPWENAQVQARWFNDTLTSAQARVCQEVSGGHGIAQNFVSVTLALQALGPMLTNDITAAAWAGFAHVSALRFIQKPGYPILQGSGLRGVLRSHAERIARTLVTQKCDASQFLARCPACSPVEPEPDQPLASCDTLLKKAGIESGVEVTDDQLCLACQLFGSTRCGSRLFVEDAPLQGEPVYKILDFLAIDRFTGGGLDGAKFDALVLWKPRFAVRLYLENPEKWELGWLTLVLRDLVEGHLSVGFGVSKGFGKVCVSNWKAQLGFIKYGDFPGEPTLVEGLETSQSGLYQVLEWKSDDSDKRRQAYALAESWVQTFIDKIDAYQRHAQIHLQTDSYFNDEVSLLYEKEVNLNA